MNGFLILLNVVFIMMAIASWIRASELEKEYKRSLEALHNSYAAGRRHLTESESLLANSKAIVAEGNEICNMIPRFRAYLRRASVVNERGTPRRSSAAIPPICYT